MVGLPVCLVYCVIKFPLRVIEPAKRNRVHDSSVGYPGTRVPLAVIYDMTYEVVIIDEDEWIVCFESFSPLYTPESYNS